MHKFNSMGHFHLFGIGYKTNHPPIYLQWIWIFGLSTEPRHVISMGPRQPDVPSEACGCPQWGLRRKHQLCVKDTVTCNNDDLLCQLGLQKSLVKFEWIYKTFFEEDAYTNITKMVAILWKSELCSTWFCPCCDLYCILYLIIRF